MNHVCFVRIKAWEWSRRTRKNQEHRLVSMWWMRGYGCLYLCCQDINEVPEELYEGQKCITKSSGFWMVYLEKPVLHASLWALNHLHGDSMENMDNSLYRFAGYNQYTFWVHNYLAKGVCKVILSCAVWKIWNECKADNDLYVPFMESKEDEERRLSTDHWNIFY